MTMQDDDDDATTQSKNQKELKSKCNIDVY